MLGWRLTDMGIPWETLLPILVIAAVIPILLVGSFLLGLRLFKKQDAYLYPQDGKMISKEKTKQLLELVGVKMERSHLQPHPDGKRLSQKENREFLKEIGLRRKGKS